MGTLLVKNNNSINYLYGLFWGKLCLEIGFVLAKNVSSTGSLWEFQKPIIYRIISLNKLLKK